MTDLVLACAASFGVGFLSGAGLLITWALRDAGTANVSDHMTD